MTLPSMTLLYVDNPLNSAAFYQRLLGQAPVELSPGFALFVLNNGFKLGMWAKQGVKPVATLTGGGGELGFLCQDPQEVEARYNQWRELGLPIEQTPTEMEFGYTFVARDPDGHRLRVYALSE
ncbi:VOC family protein [Serratia marcescens]|jgi:Lactoylglutathione lyase and related lyases|uniref:VOC family protein n=1 Tax=Serratia TaxID=613 RepID=UPI00066CAF3C|nr:MULTISPECIES: VOC family protein [Serratia]SBM07015.1 Glyoxalase-like domain [Klebsiella oxytoca]AWQ47796.1 drug:proton antiporter [Serratia marcescens]AYZ32883.1 drug:proton antiporter [Serratia sp. FDAARGOS_506]ELY1860687.1 VOC family protein [Serratia marcescens]MDU7805983.1 VOC family protein [Serratia marcescens]